MSSASITCACVATGEQCRGQVARIRTAATTGGSVAVSTARAAQRQQDLDHVRVGSRHRRRHHDDRAGSLEADQVEIGGLERVAPAADDPGIAGAAEPLPNLSSISTLSRSARMATQGRRTLSFAFTSSARAR